MKKICYILIAVLSLTLTFNIYSQETPVQQPDKELDPEIFWDHIKFYSEHLNKFAAKNIKLTLEGYKGTYDPLIKAYIAKAVGTNFDQATNKTDAFTVLHYAMQDGVEIRSISYPLEFRDYSIVRCTAAYHIGKLAAEGKLEQNHKQAAVKTLLWLLKYDCEDRVRGVAAIALAQIANSFGPATEDDKPDYNMNHYQNKFVSRAFILDCLIQYMDCVSKYDNFTAWGVIYGLGMAKSHEAFFPLLEMRRKGFCLKIKSEISKSLKLIEESK